MSEIDVLAVVRAQEDATARGDANAVVAAMSPDVVMFDLPPPLRYRGDEARNVDGLESWLSTWANGVTVRLDEPEVIIEGNLAVVHGLSRMVGTKTDGTEVDSWSRRTIVLRRASGAWAIVHEHASFPLRMDGTNQAATDLLP